MYATYPDLDNASVFITGGGSGIGAALTEGFLRQGAKVAFVQRSDAAPFCDEIAQTPRQSVGPRLVLRLHQHAAQNACVRSVALDAGREAVRFVPRPDMVSL